MVELSGIAGGVLNTVIIVGGTLFVGTIAIVAFLIFRNRKKYDCTAIVFELDGFGNPVIRFDQGGVFVDGKTNYKRFYLKNFNGSLEADSVPYVQSMKRKYVFIRRRGAKNFEYISFEGLFTNMGGITVGEEDINSAIIDYERAKKMFGTTFLSQILPYLPLIITGVFIVGVVYMVMQKLPELTTAIVEATKALRDTAQIMAQMKAGTVVQ